MHGRSRLLALFLAMLLLTLVGKPVQAAAAATAEPLTKAEAVELLQRYNIVRGDEKGNLNLTANLTRAEAAAIFVRAMNMSGLASALVDQVPFPDARGHWGAGEIALANQLGLMRGDPGGTFRPNDSITYAEVLTVLLRMIQQEPVGPWSPALILQRAQAVGIAPEGVQATERATRENTFWALASAMTVPVGGGRNLLGQYFDLTPPELQVKTPASPTTAASVNLEGTATGAIRVFVAGKEASLNRETGAFRASVALNMGRNRIQVEAVDLAGNRAMTEVEVERRPEIAKIVIEGPARIPPESSQRLTITAYDADGNKVELQDATVTLSTKEHSFDLARSTLTTGARRGPAKLTVSAGKATATYSFDVQGPAENAAALQLEPINGGRALAPGKPYTVTVRVLDDKGKVATIDYDRKVELVVRDMSGVKVTPKAAQTEKGVATFTLEAAHEGVMTLQVKSSGLETVEQEVQVLDSPRIVLTTTAKQLAPDGTSTAVIQATLMDDQGKAVNNPGRDIELELRVRGTDGYIENPFLTIPKGRSAATSTATYVAGYERGTAQIYGIVEGGRYPVQSLEIPVDAALGGVRFELTAKPTNPQPGEKVTITLRVVDDKGRTDTKASYAFQIRVTTSNREPVVNGLPEGVELYFTNTLYSPVYGGNRADVYNVIGRTYKGTAEMTLTYPRAGVVRLTPVGVQKTNEAYNQIDGFGPAASTKGYEGETLEVRFANKPARLVLLANAPGCSRLDDVLVYNDDGTVKDVLPCEVWAPPSEGLDVKVVVIDQYGDVVPGYEELITLTRIPKDRVTSIEGSSKVKARNGRADFEVWVYRGIGSDQYQATVTGLPKSNVLTVHVDS